MAQESGVSYTSVKEFQLGNEALNKKVGKERSCKHASGTRL